MASSNTLKNTILELFPDNTTKEISAADMRVFVNAVFDNKEEIVIKADDETDMKTQKAKIFEGSVVLIQSDGDNNGVYISRANNPISLLQLDKVADLAEGTILPETALGDFMIEYTHNKSYLDADYLYNAGNISGITLKSGATPLYNVTFTYTTGNITQTAIEQIGGSQTLINYTYTGSDISNKTYVFVP